MNCPECSTQNHGNSKFCKSCGLEIESKEKNIHTDEFDAVIVAICSFQALITEQSQWVFI